MRTEREIVFILLIRSTMYSNTRKAISHKPALSRLLFYVPSLSLCPSEVDHLSEVTRA
jgi:hypothetical protein